MHRSDCVPWRHSPHRTFPRRKPPQARIRHSIPLFAYSHLVRHSARTTHTSCRSVSPPLEPEGYPRARVESRLWDTAVGAGLIVCYSACSDIIKIIFAVIFPVRTSSSSSPFQSICIYSQASLPLLTSPTAYDDSAPDVKLTLLSTIASRCFPRAGLRFRPSQ